MARSSGSQDGGTGSRRGRRPVRPDPGSGPVALFAHRLWLLKEQAGDPSFADMAGRLGAAASKSSLAAAARGSALPTWETTWEFVRVLAVDRLGQDEEATRREWRAYWEQAGMGHEPDPPAPDRPSPVRKRTALVAAAIGVAGTGAALFAWAVPLIGESAQREPVPRDTPAQAVTPHDDSVFEADVTIPDGTVVKRGTSFTKIWRLRNAGTVPWRDRYLTRLNDTACRAPERVAIDPVQPGESVEIEVRVRAAAEPGRCKIYWKMTNAEGAELLAGKKPIFLDVTVS
ncbi:transcriptional regulator [Nonomuraea sp. K274]|uniref:Transcriptional regulator n=1 Tax=Nonomuraea cypriaca TaxID=1187855 RepID=A0A931AM53_9ACTN|nr:NBR1-Ig-like domain-containing protein [Nonomuraea cypriaca]MBF8192745.1 transcriptional regulator [Nonomuraea cypriaca]